MLFYLASLKYYLFYDISATFVSLLIGLIVYYLAKFYAKLWSLPPGPIPLPFFGNFLLFRGTKRHSSFEMIKMSKKYGSVFTLWLGNNPFVMIMDLDLARDAFRRNEFAGRPETYFGNLITNEKHQDIAFTDYGHTWEALRRVTHSAVRKYSTAESLPNLVTDVVDNTIKVMMEKEGIGKLFSPFDYVYNLIFNITATSVMGKRYNIDDPEYKKIKYFWHDFIVENGNRIAMWEFIPIMRWFDKSLVETQNRLLNETIDLNENAFRKHCKDFDPSVIRNFCDALIQAKNEALAEGKESAPYLTDKNLAMSCFDLFIAGIDTSQITFKWALLLLVYYPKVQQRLRQEIESVIGDRMPVQEDKHRCHYVMAFIFETMRFRSIVPLGVFRKAVVDSKLGDYTIPKGTGVFVHQHHILNEPKYWTNPEQFSPERFLEAGKFITTKPQAFIPFGLGRRVCLGETLATINQFLVLVRFLQQTNDYTIILENDCSLEPNPDALDTLMPLEYKIQLQPK